MSTNDNTTSPLQRLQQTRWQRVEEEETFNGCQVARRLVQIGARAMLPETVQELLAVPVSGAVNTGVSSFIRIS